MTQIVSQKLPHKAFFRFDKKNGINVPYFKIVIWHKELGARIRLKPRGELMGVIFGKLIHMLKEEGLNEGQAATRARQSLLDFYRACDALSNSKYNEEGQEGKASFPFDVRVYPYEGDGYRDTDDE